MKNQEVNALRVSRGKRIYIVHFLVLLYKTCLALYIFRVQSKRGANEDDAGKVVDIFIEFPPPPPPHLLPLILRKRHRSLCRQIAYSLNLSHHLYSGMTDKLSAPWVSACCSTTHAHTIIDYHLCPTFDPYLSILILHGDSDDDDTRGKWERLRKGRN